MTRATTEMAVRIPVGAVEALTRVGLSIRAGGRGTSSARATHPAVSRGERDG